MNNRTRRSRMLAALAGTTIGSTAVLAQPVVTHLGSAQLMTAVGISDDHTVVAGYSFNFSFAAFRWTQSGGLQDLGSAPGSYDIAAGDVSGDGSTIVGSRRNLLAPDTSVAVRWVNGGAFQPLPTLPGYVSNYASSVSTDGSVIVGRIGTTPTAGLAARWANSSVQSIGTLPGDTNSTAGPVSGDGRVIFGASGVYPDWRVFRWTATGGMTPLAMPAGTRFSSGADTNFDGTVLIGDARTLNPDRAVGFIWTPSTGARTLLTPSEPGDFFVQAASDDGSLVGGNTTIEAALNHGAAIWKPSLGVVSLRSYLAELGANTDGWQFHVIRAVSADGTAVGGYGTYQGQEAGFLITGLPTPCAADFNADGVLNSQDFFRFLSAFFAQSPTADFNRDTTVTSQDFFDFLGAFFVGCG